MRKLLLLFILLAVPAIAQNIRYDGIAQGPKGSVPNATVAFCSQPANISTTPCSPLLSLCSSLSDVVCSQPNPITADSLGNFHAYVKSVNVPFTVQIYGPQVAAPYVLVDQGTGGSGGGGGATLTPIVQTSTQTGATSDVRISNAITSCSGANCIVWANDSTAQTWAACPTWGSANVTLVLFAVTYTYSGTAATCVVPTNITLAWYNGALLSPANTKTINIQGGIVAGTQQIFSNAISGQGTIDLTGNYQVQDVYPEWWGALAGGNATTNQNTIQAAIIGAYGSNRTNGSGNLVYNKRLNFSGTYSVAGSLNLYHMNGFYWRCQERLSCLLTETSANTILLNMQSTTYGTFDQIGFSTTAAQDINHPLVNADFSGSQGADLRPQFLDFKENNWNGASIAKVLIDIAPSGGGAQGSNIVFHNNSFQAATEAAVMVGQASGGTCINIATNAVAIHFVNGDFQSNPTYAIENCGGSQIYIDGTSFEDGFATQTGSDYWCGNIPAGGKTEIRNVRSESLLLATSTTCAIDFYHDYNVDQASFPANGLGVGTIIEGSITGGHGMWFRVSVSGSYSGLGNPSSTRTAASGTSTTLVDSVGGLTVNAWVGYYVSILSGTGQYEYGIVTSNTATTFTMAAGFVTDFAGVTIVAPDNTSQYIVEPAWNSQTSAGALTWAAVTQTFNVSSIVADDLFVPGLKFNFDDRFSTFRNLRVTRSDWAPLGGEPYGHMRAEGVLVGFTNPGTGDVSGIGPFRLSSFPAGGAPIGRYKTFDTDQHSMGAICFQGAATTQGTATLDACLEPQNGAGTNSGFMQMINNSTGTAYFSKWNPDSSYGLTPVTFATLTACSASNEGAQAAVKDSTVNTYGTTIVGGGTNHVHAYCNGTNWVVD